MVPAVMPVTDRSMAAKAYQATALARAVSAAIPQKARNNLALTPRTWPAGVIPAGFTFGLSLPLLLVLAWDILHPILRLRARLWWRYSASRSSALMLPSA